MLRKTTSRYNNSSNRMSYNRILKIKGSAMKNSVKINKYILTIPILLVLSTNANSQFVNGHNLLISCKAAVTAIADSSKLNETEKYSAIDCLAFINGVEEGYKLANLNNPDKVPFCIPKKLSLSERAMSIVNYLEKLSGVGADLNTLPASGLVIDAYNFYYPCEKNRKSE